MSELFLGRDLQRRGEVSEQTAQLVDAEVKRVITVAYDRAREVIQQNIELLKIIATALLERETLTREDIETISRGESLPPIDVRSAAIIIATGTLPARAASISVWPG